MFFECFVYQTRINQIPKQSFVKSVENLKSLELEISSQAKFQKLSQFDFYWS